MTKGAGSAAGRLSALVVEIEAAAYARGQADARREILTALGAAEKPASSLRRSRPPAERPAGKSRTSAGRRAPRGAVRALIERALRDRPGSTPPDILDCAATDGERLVKLTSIRVELHEGRRQGRYEARDGRWSLAGTDSSVEYGAPDTPAPPEPDGAASTATGDAPAEDAEAREPESGESQDRLGMNW